MDAYRGASIAIVIRETQVSSPASLVNSMAQTWVLRPMCTGRVVPMTQPLVTPLRWLALMSRPTVRWPSGAAKAAPQEPSAVSYTHLTLPTNREV